MANAYLDVGNICSAAWQKVKGNKLPFFLGLILILAINGLENYTGDHFEKHAPFLAFLIILFFELLLLLIKMGLVYAGLQVAKNLPINFKTILYTMDVNVALRIVIAYLLQTLIYLPIILIAIFASVFLYSAGVNVWLIGLTVGLLGTIAVVYLMVRLSLLWGFLLDQNETPWDSIKLSFRASQDNFWKLFLLLLITLAITIVSLITLGIAFIWTLPWMLIIYGLTFYALLPNAAKPIVSAASIKRG